MKLQILRNSNMKVRKLIYYKKTFETINKEINENYLTDYRLTRPGTHK